MSNPMSREFTCQPVKSIVFIPFFKGFFAFFTLHYLKIKENRHHNEAEKKCYLLIYFYLSLFFFSFLLFFLSFQSSQCMSAVIARRLIPEEMEFIASISSKRVAALPSPEPNIWRHATR